MKKLIYLKVIVLADYENFENIFSKWLNLSFSWLKYRPCSEIVNQRLQEHRLQTYSTRTVYGCAKGCIAVFLVSLFAMLCTISNVCLKLIEKKSMEKNKKEN